MSVLFRPTMGDGRQYRPHVLLVARRLLAGVVTKGGLGRRLGRLIVKDAAELPSLLPRPFGVSISATS